MLLNLMISYFLSHFAAGGIAITKVFSVTLLGRLLIGRAFPALSYIVMQVSWLQGVPSVP